MLIPVYDDWESLILLLSDLSRCAEQIQATVDVIAINDGSAKPLSLNGEAAALRGLNKIFVIHLVRNLGHQRAIAVGIAHLLMEDCHDYILTMDADGEDRPEDVGTLLSVGMREQVIVVAQRAERSEPGLFRMFYRMYQLLFRVLIGHNIDFGNFSLIPRRDLQRIAFMTELWNHFPGALIRSRLPIVRVPTQRGLRYAGRSKMSFVGLITHGLSALAVFSDLLFVRIAMFACAISVLGAIGGILVLAVRMFTNLSVPGWATTAAGVALLVVLQGLTLSITAAFITLGNRSVATFVPAVDALKFIAKIEKVKT